MSELKAKHVVDVYDEYSANPTNEAQVYLKSEADKVIAELEESHKMEVGQLLIEIAELKNKLQNVSSLLKETREWLIVSQKLHKRCADNAVKVINHHKYKRCLKMAKWCGERIARIEKDYAFWRYGKDYASNFYKRWKKRWLELAKKFKERSDV